MDSQYLLMFKMYASSISANFVQAAEKLGKCSYTQKGEPIILKGKYLKDAHESSITIFRVVEDTESWPQVLATLLDALVEAYEEEKSSYQDPARLTVFHIAIEYANQCNFELTPQLLTKIKRLDATLAFSASLMDG